MELIAMVVLALPIGLLVRSRTAAFITYIAIHSFLFPFQTLSLTREWIGGDYSAFDQDPNVTPWPYLAVNAVIYAVGLGLVALGHRLARKRRQRRSANGQAVDLSA